MAAVFDVTDLAAVRAGVAGIEASLGPVDILVNNEGVALDPGGRITLFREMDPSRWHINIDLNLYGVLNCCKAVIDGMCERRWGRIVTVSSSAGQQGVGIGTSAYSAGKGGAISFMRDLAVEVGQYGVRCNTLALGLMENALSSTAIPNKTLPAGTRGQRSRRWRRGGVAGRRRRLGHGSDHRPQRRSTHPLTSNDDAGRRTTWRPAGKARR